MRTLLRTRLRPMHAEDIPQIMDIERESFPTMWPQTAYKRELQNRAARYFVLVEEQGDAPGDTEAPGGFWSALRRMVTPAEETGERVLGFLGIWLMVGEVHVVTVAVRERFRRMGIAERLLIACIELAMEHDQEVVTLEVRKSNVAAQDLYTKYGFDRVGLRVRYYTDNQEDAVIMTTPDLTTPSYGRLFEGLRARHRERHPDLWT